MTCFGTSTKPKVIELEVDLPPDELEQLQNELAEAVQRASARLKRE